MNFRSLLLAGALLSAAGANAQTWVSDSITQGPAYATDVWYSMANGTVNSASNKMWSMAFATAPQMSLGSVAVWINPNDTVTLWSISVPGADFDAATFADTTGKVRRWNGPTSWADGAFNSNSAGFPSYGWGTYDADVTHQVYGDSLYMMQVNTQFYKVFIKDFISDIDGNGTDTSHWTFRIAQMDGTGDTTIRINMADYGKKNFAYYDAPSRTMMSRDPDSSTWDVLFTRYTDSLNTGGGFGPTTTAGALLNHRVKAAQVDNISPDTVMYNNYAYESTLNVIGWDWRTADQTGNFTTDTNRTYFIKARDGAYWQMVITRFTGTSNSKTVFKKRKVAMTGVANVASSVQRFLVSPVPANNNINLVLEAANGAGQGQVAITDMSGRVVYQAGIRVGAGMNAYGIQTGNLPAGNYILTARGEGFAVSQQVVIAR